MRERAAEGEIPLNLASSLSQLQRSLTSQFLSSGSLSGTKGTSLIDLEEQKSLSMLPLLPLLLPLLLLLLRRGDERGANRAARKETFIFSVIFLCPPFVFLLHTPKGKPLFQ